MIYRIRGLKMNIEYEMTILEINKEELVKKLESLGATKIADSLQRRYVYDFNPIDPNKWIRLRTNGKKTTLTIKQVFDKTKIGGTNELEIEVDDFDKTNLILNELGYKIRNYQENYRTSYVLNEVNFDIDSWPLIPTYVEIEGKDEQSVKKALKLLDLGDFKTTTLDVDSIYNEIYNIKVMDIKEFKI